MEDPGTAQINYAAQVCEAVGEVIPGLVSGESRLLQAEAEGLDTGQAQDPFIHISNFSATPTHILPPLTTLSFIHEHILHFAVSLH